MPRNMFYSVTPRYSGGSPAMVDQSTALRVVQDERGEYEAALSGIYGAEKKARAEREGLDFIVVCMDERRDRWDVADAITGKHHQWFLSVRCKDCGRRVRCSRGRIDDHHTTTRGPYGLCAQSGRYVGVEVENG